MKLTGPDSLNSWIICLACCFINMVIFGISRVSGILFVATIERFKVERTQASMPFAFAICLRCSSGPLVGYFGHKFGVRAVTSCGALAGAIGVGLCFFAESITTVILLWGIFFGSLAFGFGNILVPISINKNFVNYRATASGLAFSGSCIGSFILSPILDILLSNYGLSQTYLFLSGFILNCVPAALLLRNPSFKIQGKNQSDKVTIKEQNLVKGTKYISCEFERDLYKPEMLENHNSDTSIIPKNKKNCIKNQSALSMELSSSQIFLSNHSVHMDTSESVDDDKTVVNKNMNRVVDLHEMEEDTFNSSSEVTFQDNTTKKYYCLDKEIIECEQKRSHFKESDNLICDPSFHNKEYDNYEISQSLHSGINEFQDFNKISNDACVFDCSKRSESKCNDKPLSNFTLINQECPKMVICPQTCKKMSSENLTDHSNELEFPREGEKDEKILYPRTKKQSTLSAFRVIYNPVFVLIAFSNAIYNSTFLCMITVVVDFSRDLLIEASYEKYILMLLSVGDLTGRLGLGWIIDRRYMTTPAFVAACFASQSLVTATIVCLKDFTLFAVFITLYGFSQAGLIFIFPIIIAQYIEFDKQTLAIPSSYFLSGPLCLAVAPIIGYFRDEIGAYDWIFYGIAIISAVTSIVWMLFARIEKSRRKN